jgi:hypothetical protein
LLFQKPTRSTAGINIVVAITGFISPPSYIWKYSTHWNWPGNTAANKKKPGNAPGFFDEYLFSISYFASLAI